MPERPEQPARPDDEPVLPDLPPDETDVAWGDEPARRDDDDWYLRERPPHHE